MKKLVFTLLMAVTAICMFTSCSSDDEKQKEIEDLGKNMIVGKWRLGYYDKFDTYNFGWDFNSDNTGVHYETVDIYQDKAASTSFREEFTYVYDGIILTYKTKDGVTHKRRVTPSGTSLYVYESEDKSSNYIILKKFEN